MNLKGIMQTLGVKPGQVVSNPYVRAFAPQVETIVKEEEDHEVSMAQNSLDTIIKMATELKGKLGESEKDIPAWIQDHITNAENYISQAASNYHEYKANESRISEDSPCWKGYKQVGMKDKGGKQVPNCVPISETIKEAGLYGGVPKMYVKYMAVQKKVKELEDKQKALAAKYFSEKELNKKEKMLVDLKKGTATLAGYRKNLADIEEKYINNLYKDAEYTGEE